MRILYYVFLYPLCLFHLIAYKFANREIKALVDSDIEEMNRRKKTINRSLLYWLVFHKPYRNLFYLRVPSSRRLRFILPEYPLFYILVSEGIGKKAFVLNHPYGTIINAKRIGANFTCCQLTTIGNRQHGQNNPIPTIGNNVSLGAGVTIIGDVTIGDNVTIGAGSVVVENIPSNCVAVGNPCRVVKYLTVSN